MIRPVQLTDCVIVAWDFVSDPLVRRKRAKTSHLRCGAMRPIFLKTIGSR